MCGGTRQPEGSIDNLINKKHTIYSAWWVIYWLSNRWGRRRGRCPSDRKLVWARAILQKVIHYAMRLRARRNRICAPKLAPWARANKSGGRLVTNNINTHAGSGETHTHTQRKPAPLGSHTHRAECNVCLLDANTADAHNTQAAITRNWPHWHLGEIKRVYSSHCVASSPPPPQQS